MGVRTGVEIQELFDTDGARIDLLWPTPIWCGYVVMVVVVVCWGAYASRLLTNRNCQGPRKEWYIEKRLVRKYHWGRACHTFLGLLLPCVAALPGLTR